MKNASVLVVGSVALDSIKTPWREHPRLLGGSGTHAAIAASLFAPVRLAGVVGDDFPRRYLRQMQLRGIDLEGLQIRAGKTFHWTGEYEVNMNNRRTLSTELGVLGDYRPELPAAWRDTAYVVLANNAPPKQHAVLDQLSGPRFVAADTMDLWLNTALAELKRLLRRVDALVLNDGEARQLAGQDHVVAAFKPIHRMGPRWVIIKKGEHGALVSGPDGLFLAPAYPLPRVGDPTGAGDSFLGGLVGHLAQVGGDPRRHMRAAVMQGSTVASFCCEGFGVSRTMRVTKALQRKRLRELERMSHFKA